MMEEDDTTMQIYDEFSNDRAISDSIKPNISHSPVKKRPRPRKSSFQNDEEEELPASLLFQMSQDSCDRFSQFSQDCTDRLDQMHFRGNDSGYHEENCMSQDGFAIPLAPRFNAPNSGRKYSNVAANPFNKSSLFNRVLSGENEKQIDLPPSIKNIFLKEDNAIAAAGNGRTAKLWISAFKERPRFITDFEELHMLGEGHFSTVYCVRNRLDGTLYAIKKIKEQIQNANHGNLLIREPCALAVLRNCSSIINYFGCWLDDGQLHILTEHCTGGTLEDLISYNPSQGSYMKRRKAYLTAADKNCSDSFHAAIEPKKSDTYQPTLEEKHQHQQALPQGIREELVWLILQEIGEALNYMHSHGMVHLDLRPANIFFTSDNDYSSLSNIPDSFRRRSAIEDLLVKKSIMMKLGDFGHCVKSDWKGVILEGESRYCARELINSEIKCVDLTKSDIFSLGISVYEMCLGRPLGTNDNNDDSFGEWHSIRDGIFDNQALSHYSRELIELLVSMMHSNVNIRPTANDLLQLIQRKKRNDCMNISPIGVNFDHSPTIVINNTNVCQLESMTCADSLAAVTSNCYAVTVEPQYKDKDQEIYRLSIENEELKLRLECMEKILHGYHANGSMTV
eukprot:gene14740-19813_t